MIYFFLVFFILTTVTFAYLSYVSYIKYNKALKYTEAYVLFISSLWYKFKETKMKMNEIDRRGSFEADDEVGHTFTALQECIDELYEFITKYVNKEDESKKD
jgi:hypothetical protein